MKKINILAVIFVILSLFVFTGCSDSKGTATVTIDLGFTEHNISMLDRVLNFFTLFGSEAHAATAPANITDIILTVAAPDMTTIETLIPADTGYLTLDVPAGKNRTFTVTASGGGREYNGSQTVDLPAGENTPVGIHMELADRTFIIQSAESIYSDCEPKSMAMDSENIYIAGNYYQSSACMWRIEKRDRGTGALVTDFGTGGVIISGGNTLSTAYSIAVDSYYVYIAGIIDNMQWRIEKRDKITGNFMTAFDSDGHVEWPASYMYGGSTPYCLTADTGYIYTGGSDMEIMSGISSLRVEKRYKTDGATYSSIAGTAFEFGYFTEYLSNPTRATSIAVSSGYLYIAAVWNQSAGVGNSTRLEKRVAETGEPDTANWGTGLGYITLSDIFVSSISINSGSVFAAGSIPIAVGNADIEWRIDKYDITAGTLVTAFDTDGILLSNPTSYSDEALSIAIDSGYIYAAGYAYAGSEDYQWRIEKRNISTGAYDTGFGTNGYITLNPASGINTPDECNYILVDDTYIYIIGSDNSASSGYSQWRIEKRLKSTGRF